MFKYRLLWVDGSEAEKAAYAATITAGEEILISNGGRLRVLDVVQVEEEDSPYIGLLKVEAV